MNNKKLFLFNEIEGDWIIHQTFYYLHDKTIKINKQNTSITKLNSLQHLSDSNVANNYYLYEHQTPYNAKILYQYLYNKDLKNSGIINKTCLNINTKYNFTSYHNHYLKISYQQKDIKYSEYIYPINTNLKISIIMIKKFNKYIAICFTSEIKMNK